MMVRKSSVHDVKVITPASMGKGRRLNANATKNRGTAPLPDKDFDAEARGDAKNTVPAREWNYSEGGSRRAIASSISRHVAGDPGKPVR
jgi:hypothetical protein